MKHKTYIIGLDIGGSKIRAIIWDGEKTLAARQVKTPKNFIDFKKEIFKLATWQPGCQVIGIGAAGIISGTKIVRSPNIKYLRNFDFKTLLSGRTAKLDNDARCFARSVIGSAEDGFQKKQTILTVTLGTGIGRGLVKNGKVQKIKQFEYPEKWERKYQKVRGKPKAVMAGEFAEFLARNLSPIIKKHKVDAVVFGGGVTDRSGFRQKMQSAFRQCRINTKVYISRLGKNAVAIGAALLK